MKTREQKGRFRKDSSKKYIRKFRIYPSFLYKNLDKWLNKMSLSGYHLVDSNFASFLFECGEPQSKIYFTYNSGWGRNDSGKYSIPLRYPFLEKTYGVKPKHSELNSNRSKAYYTLEIDTQKIDVNSDVGYKELITDRNRLYTRLAIRDGAILFTTLLICFLAFLLI